VNSVIINISVLSKLPYWRIKATTVAVNGTKIANFNGLDKNYWIKSVICGKNKHITVKKKPLSYKLTK